MTQKTHGNTGNRNAAKKNKLTERLNVTVAEGTKARIKTACDGKVSPWLRGAIEEKLNQEKI